eukprot:TRINITY_DN22331_c0_g1_i1.p1 TRINITY_DN22331_c0_g1~~TRINITY_DN22331_c0_g1_i1.p1  ORF type:complete len:463 (+),score=135.27 TRINITY_DN22331_c0_g1_i1:99-1487(+)
MAAGAAGNAGALRHATGLLETAQSLMESWEWAQAVAALGSSLDAAANCGASEAEAVGLRAEVHACLGQCHLRLQRHAEAVDCCTKALLLGAGAAAVPLGTRAVAHEALGNLAAAETDWRRLAACLGPQGGEDALREAARLRLARCSAGADRGAAAAGAAAAAAAPAGSQGAAAAAGGTPLSAPATASHFPGVPGGAAAAAGPPSGAGYGGCAHYRRRCKMYCPDCGLLVPCRLCHDELVATHKLDRFRVNLIQCQVCCTDQPPSQRCKSCFTEFSEYYCDICHLWTCRPSRDHPADFIWHCEKCGLCRIGFNYSGRSSYMHCDKCDSCWPTGNLEHRCLRRGARGDCPVCLEDLHSSTRSIEMTDCGHFMHNTCKKQMLQQGQFACPLCQKSFSHSMEPLIEHIIARHPLPEEHRGLRAMVHCNDCNVSGEVPFNFIAMRCGECNSFNTTQIGGGIPPPTDS